MCTHRVCFALTREAARKGIKKSSAVRRPYPTRQGCHTMSMSSWSDSLSDEVMAAAREAFEKHDFDNSGTIHVEVCPRSL